ncbi:MULTISPECIES: hemolysin family protein [unclassified Nocardia]|uniref:hemolysin family protein n=1 Tax=unclassified Nocardia TaxID=2637762 RepID=UPI0024A88703|nr:MULTISPECIES: hemolysin family protein [unclassified Nocardia]
MSGYWFNLALVAVLVIANALFAGSEIALISLRDSQITRLDRQRGTAAVRILVRLARDPNRYLATIQIGITLAGFLASATAAVTLAEPLATALEFLGATAQPVAVITVTLLLTFATLVLGELAPKRLAMQYSQRWALLAARPIDLLSRLSRPIVWLLATATDLTVRLFGGDPKASREQLSPAELRDLVAGHRGLTPEQRTIILGALDIHERVLRQILVPRRAVFTLPADLPVTDASHALAHAGHSRAPVVAGTHLDDTIGVVNLRTLLDDATSLTDAARPATVLPDTLRVSDALRRFKNDHEQFALVVNEHGTVEGIVTLEDLLEEIVGEIYDDTDRDLLAVHHEPDGSLLLPGSFPVHDLTDLGVDLADAPDGDYTTIAGMALILLGRIPRMAGDRLPLTDWTIEITGTDTNTITEVRLHPTPRPPRT